MTDESGDCGINKGENIVPHNKIVCVAQHPKFEDSVYQIVEPLRDRQHRESLGKHSFHCLPVVIGNQYGFVIKSMVTWSAIWNGGPDPSDTRIKIDLSNSDSELQLVSSHFGNGIITIQNRFSFRTAPGINLMVLDPPNYFRENLQNLFASVETDNLRRDFTFNLKIIRSGKKVKVRRGDIISAVIPIPRYFVDDFSIELANDHFSFDDIRAENEQSEKFAARRSGEDVSKPQAVGKLYWRGLDADETPFEDHQRQLRPAGWSDKH